LSRDRARKDDDLGEEVDAQFSVDLYENLNVTSRGGVFFPGDAALLLVNGNTDNEETAWEWKNTLTYKF
ncbi:MAG: hypothetical protein ABEK50_14095, partial [bacterium]